MDFSDERWSKLKGGYGTFYDPRNALKTLEVGGDQEEAWAELWKELHHQGDVGEASFASVPVIARLVVNGKTIDWNPYALVATIEGARQSKESLEVPEWLSIEYAEAWRHLYTAGVDALENALDESLICSIMAVLAHYKRQPMLARMAILSESERGDMLNEVGWG